MKILLPDNIFSRILSSALNQHDHETINFYPSGLLSKNLSNSRDSIALIPTLDLLNHKDFFVSQSLGISFDESISNSYIYFNQKEKLEKEVILAGDVSSNEAVLTKILFAEVYGIDVQLSFEKINGGTSEKNQVLVGDRNFIEDNLNSAISFTEEIIELISAPYVNFVFAGESEDTLKDFQSKYQEIIAAIEPSQLLEKMNYQFSTAVKNYWVDNIQHVVFNFNAEDLEGIELLLELPYFQGIIDHMIDVKFV
jgi:hypothetical protein